MELGHAADVIKSKKLHRVRAWPGLVLAVCGLLVLTSLGPAQASAYDPFGSATPEEATSPRLPQRAHRAPSTATSRQLPVLAARTATGGRPSSVPAPEAVTLDRRTQTLYVGGAGEDGRLYVLDARTCSAPRPRCGDPLASVPTGVDPADIAVDPASGTVYVSNFNGETSGTVTVIDGRHCNARDVSGCGGPVTQVDTGGHALGLQLDRRRHTLYVGNADSFVSILDTQVCNAARTGGCTGALTHVTTGSNAAFPYLDRTTDTLYVPQNDFHEEGDVVDVVDISHCNATNTSRCSRPPVTFPVGVGAAFAVVDHASDTLYVSSQGVGLPGDGSASVVDARSCNARDTSGCPTSAPPTALVGPGAFNLAVAPRTHTLYGLASESDLVSVIDTRHCRAHETSGCGRPPRTVQTGIDPFWMTLDRHTGSLYLANLGDDTVQVLDASRCSGVRADGCRRTAPVAPATSNTRVVSDVHTIYQSANFASEDSNKLSFIDSRTCNRRDRTCAARASIELGYYPQIYVDPGSHTLYLVDTEADVVHLVDTRTCNVSRQNGCAPVADVPIAGVSGLIANPRSHTVYANQDDATTIAVLPGAHCNALDHTRCTGTVREVELGSGSNVVSFDIARDTVYVGTPDAGTITLLPSSACDVGSAACVAVAHTAVTGLPIGQQTVPAVHSLYVAGSFGADVVTVIDTQACRASNTSGCATTWPTTPMPHQPFGLDYDRQADKVVVTSWDANLTILDPHVCSAATVSGCQRGWPHIPVGFRPVYFGADARENTLYTFNFYDQTVSMINLAHPCRPHLCVRPSSGSS